MANLNPLLTGDVPFPQYSVTTTQEIDAGVTITKGVIYTKNTDGELIVNPGTPVFLAKGIYQARETPFVNVPALAGDEVQVLGPRSRILMVDSAGGLVEGDNVDNTENTDEVVISSALLDESTIANNYIGRVFEIYTKDSVTGSKKKVAAMGDLVIVETVGP